MSSALDRCVACGESFSFSLTRCQNCHKQVCESCTVRRGGAFCGDHCAHVFFFGGDDEDAGGEGRAQEE